MKNHVIILFLILTLSIGFVGYSASQSALATPATPSGRPTIFDLRPCLLFPDICNLRLPEDQIPPDQGPVCLSCPILDISNLNLNESLILTQFGGSVIVTKVPTESILNQDVVAQLNITNVTGTMSGGQ
jgi:hypothetical protein